MRLLTLLSLFVVSSLMIAPNATAQLLDTKLISLAAAKQMAAAAEAEAERINQHTVAIAIVDAAGELILFHRRDGTQLASIDIALNKARTAARFRRTTKVMEDAVADGRNVLLATTALPIEGGVPIEVGGQVIGAIGVSGVPSNIDAQIAAAGVAALRP